MNKKELRRKISDRLYNIRGQYRNDRGKRMTQEEFTTLLNKTEPLDITFETMTYGSWERSDRMCPADKYEKILSMDKSK